MLLEVLSRHLLLSRAGLSLTGALQTSPTVFNETLHIGHQINSAFCFVYISSFFFSLIMLNV